jgi:hypothetical protein
MKYDTIVFGGSLHSVGINGIRLIKNNLDKLRGKNLIVFATGASPDRAEILNKILMTLLKWKLLSKKDKSPDERGMLAAYSRSLDFTRKEHIAALVRYTKSLENTA